MNCTAMFLIRSCILFLSGVPALIDDCMTKPSKARMDGSTRLSVLCPHSLYYTGRTRTYTIASALHIVYSNDIPNICFFGLASSCYWSLFSIMLPMFRFLRLLASFEGYSQLCS